MAFRKVISSSASDVGESGGVETCLLFALFFFPAGVFGDVHSARLVARDARFGDDKLSPSGSVDRFVTLFDGVVVNVAARAR